MEWHIDYYQKENGEIPVLEFLISLPPKLRAKTQSTIDLLEACGTNLQAPYVAPVKGDKYKGLWELRVKQASDITRVFYFTFKDNRFILLHGFRKKTAKTPSSELDRAMRYRRDFERREDNEQSKRQRGEGQGDAGRG